MFNEKVQAQKVWIQINFGTNYLCDLVFQVPYIKLFIILIFIGLLRRFNVLQSEN